MSQLPCRAKSPSQMTLEEYTVHYAALKGQDVSQLDRKKVKSRWKKERKRGAAGSESTERSIQHARQRMNSAALERMPISAQDLPASASGRCGFKPMNKKKLAQMAARKTSLSRLTLATYDPCVRLR